MGDSYRISNTTTEHSRNCAERLHRMMKIHGLAIVITEQEGKHHFTLHNPENNRRLAFYVDSLSGCINGVHDACERISLFILEPPCSAVVLKVVPDHGRLDASQNLPALDVTEQAGRDLARRLGAELKISVATTTEISTPPKIKLKPPHK